jgi:acetylornithine deacetylase/succinyl-diaminopimelate desuccinylase-like protein
MARVAVPQAGILDQVDMDEMLRLAQALIRIPSVNPPGEEAAVAEWLGPYLNRAGLPVDVSEVLPGRPNVVAIAEFGDGGPTILLNGHTDVVAVGEGWDGDPFSGMVRDGKLYGRGAADMKGPLAAMIEATRAVQRARVARHGRVVVTAVMGEEYGGVGTGSCGLFRPTPAFRAIGSRSLTSSTNGSSRLSTASCRRSASTPPEHVHNREQNCRYTPHNGLRGLAADG